MNKPTVIVDFFMSEADWSSTEGAEQHEETLERFEPFAQNWLTNYFPEFNIEFEVHPNHQSKGGFVFQSDDLDYDEVQELQEDFNSASYHDLWSEFWQA